MSYLNSLRISLLCLVCMALTGCFSSIVPDEQTLSPVDGIAAWLASGVVYAATWVAQWFMLGFAQLFVMFARMVNAYAVALILMITPLILMIGLLVPRWAPGVILAPVAAVLFFKGVDITFIVIDSVASTLIPAVGENKLFDFTIFQNLVPFVVAMMFGAAYPLTGYLMFNAGNIQGLVSMAAQQAGQATNSLANKGFDAGMTAAKVIGVTAAAAVAPVVGAATMSGTGGAAAAAAGKQALATGAVNAISGGKDPQQDGGQQEILANTSIDGTAGATDVRNTSTANNKRTQNAMIDAGVSSESISTEFMNTGSQQAKISIDERSLNEISQFADAKIDGVKAEFSQKGVGQNQSLDEIEQATEMKQGTAISAVDNIGQDAVRDLGQQAPQQAPVNVADNRARRAASMAEEQNIGFDSRAGAAMYVGMRQAKQVFARSLRSIPGIGPMVEELGNAFQEGRAEYANVKQYQREAIGRGGTGAEGIWNFSGDWARSKRLGYYNDIAARTGVGHQYAQSLEQFGGHEGLARAMRETKLNDVTFNVGSLLMQNAKVNGLVAKAGSREDLSSHIYASSKRRGVKQVDNAYKAITGETTARMHESASAEAFKDRGHSNMNQRGTRQVMITGQDGKQTQVTIPIDTATEEYFSLTRKSLMKMGYSEQQANEMAEDVMTSIAESSKLGESPLIRLENKETADYYIETEKFRAALGDELYSRFRELNQDKIQKLYDEVDQVEKELVHINAFDLKAQIAKLEAQSDRLQPVKRTSIA